jgi:hypothetical protein
MTSFIDNLDVIIIHGFSKMNNDGVINLDIKDLRLILRLRQTNKEIRNKIDIFFYLNSHKQINNIDDLKKGIFDHFQ